jgi:GNAT superfamily N-acetyltransferase
MTNPLLDNIFWHALSGPQKHFSQGSATARRFAPGFSPILAFADTAQPDFAALDSCCPVGESFYVGDWSGAAPQGWRIDVEKQMVRMAWAGGPAPEAEAVDAIPLEPRHAEQAVALAELTRPGPFGPRTLELGDYFGCFHEGRLIAMAGERTTAGTLREVSGVCTHPDFQGRGLARRLMVLLLRRQLARGETPFLHVMSDNDGAHGLYQRLGFRDHALVQVRVMTRLA